MKKLIFSSWFGLLALVSQAQTAPTSEAFWGGALPSTVTQQQAVLASQAATGASADLVTLSQRGSGNQAYYRAPAGNQVAMIQDGDGNLLNLSLNGNLNNYLLEQRGNGNTLTLDGMQGDKLNVQVRQAGNGNDLRLTENSLINVGSTASPIRIEQTGGARAVITSSYFSAQ
ncbi:hypothetical protein FAES_0064 [Fibrella aestuarina BUZ 2]|uniref:Curlin associated repeat-containing protein n=1 Tax=Fibrella aestuarina BUZ 2 TaxID=1166018 RepID=I0K1S5_9BACT|nr:hypothetical protein [Fibrella aestuarina]CCG98078.1 hypothetical protein FAES_0064 [Fibrella aestuarina BUZ 2]